jgi:hypothetical protein
MALVVLFKIQQNKYLQKELYPKKARGCRGSKESKVNNLPCF